MCLRRARVYRSCSHWGAGVGGPGGVPEPYTAKGAHFLSTWADGAVTVRSHSTGLIVETFATNQRFVLRTEPGEN